MVMSVATATAGLSEAELDRAFGALADPTRRAILARLAEGDAGVLDVAAPFPMSQPAITKHLGVLEDAGLISRHRLARRRMCHLEPQRLKQLSDWVGSYREVLGGELRTPRRAPRGAAGLAATGATGRTVAETQEGEGT